METQKENKAEKAKDGLALVVGGLFILALVFAAYNYFSKGAKAPNKIDDNNLSFVEKEKPAEETGSVNGAGATDIKKDAEEVKPIAETPKAPVAEKPVVTTPTTSTPVSTPVIYQSTWIANDYKAGDIKAGSYTVKTGDTLWEVAEAAYGKGADWVKILNANKSSIGFLANGTQAMIVPGQVLVLP